MTAHLPHYLTAAPSRLHLDLADDLASLHLARGQRRNVVGPRGSGKTAWSTKGYGLYVGCERLEPYVLFLSETEGQAVSFLDAIRDELENNPAVAEHYPGACGVGPVWQQAKLRLRNGVLMQARGVGGSIRGLTNRAERPSLIIVDDPNEDADAYSPTLRRRKLDWFNKAVMAVGGPDTNVVVLGTAIHREAIVCELRGGQQSGAWQTRTYRSVIAWPTRTDLWAEWERLFANLSDPGRAATARAFYDANRAEMDAGAEVLWPGREDLYALMVHRAAVGPSAFACEKQDVPGTDGATEWPPEYFDWPGLWFDQWPHGLVCKLQSLDPSKGATAKPGDYQAHVLLALHRDGTLYFDAEFRREPEWVGRALEIADRWRPLVLVAEGNNTMGLLMPEFNRRADELRKAGRGFPLTCVEKNHTAPKLARIRSLGGYFSRRQVRVRNTPGGRMLVDQWRDVPTGEYDDGPDAAATAVWKLQELYAKE